MTDSAAADAKEQFRQDYRRRRRQLPAPERTTQSAALTRRTLELLSGLRARAEQGEAGSGARWHGRVASVMSYGAEPDTTGLHERLHAKGIEVYVPVSLPERQLGWVRWFPGVAMQRSAVAPIDEPVGPRAGVEVMRHVDVVFVPAQAVDAAGYRMGQGGGYYDRFLAELDQLGTSGHRPLTVAVVYEHEFVAQVPRDALDRPTDAVLTPEGLHWSVRTEH